MEQKIKAIYRKGAFILKAPFELPEESEVELVVQGPTLLPPEVTDPAERTRILDRVLERMQQNPIPAEAPRLTREVLHERR